MIISASQCIQSPRHSPRLKAEDSNYHINRRQRLTTFACLKELLFGQASQLRLTKMFNEDSRHNQLKEDLVASIYAFISYAINRSWLGLKLLLLLTCAVRRYVSSFIGVSISNLPNFAKLKIFLAPCMSRCSLYPQLHL